MFIRMGFATLALLVSTAPFAAPGVELLAPGKPAQTIDAAAMAALPAATVMASAHDAPPSAWQGVSLLDVLRKAGAPLDHALRGKALARVVRVSAADGYQVVFSLGELDTSLGKTIVVLADRHEGKPLTDDGPYRLIVPADKRAARSVRNVTRIELLDVGT